MGDADDGGDDIDAFDIDAFEAAQVPVIQEGYLMKKKQKGVMLGGKWQRRYFCLDNTNRALTYSPNKNSMQRKMVPFNHIEDCKINTAKGGGKRFEIFMMKDTGQEKEKNKGRVFVLEAETKEDAETWVENVKRLSSKHIQRKKVMHDAVRQHRATMSHNSRFRDKLTASPQAKGGAAAASALRTPVRHKRFSTALKDSQARSQARALETDSVGITPESNKCFCCAVQ